MSSRNNYKQRTKFVIGQTQPEPSQIDKDNAAMQTSASLFSFAENEDIIMSTSISSTTTREEQKLQGRKQQLPKKSSLAAAVASTTPNLKKKGYFESKRLVVGSKPKNSVSPTATPNSPLPSPEEDDETIDYIMSVESTSDEHPAQQPENQGQFPKKKHFSVYTGSPIDNNVSPSVNETPRHNDDSLNLAPPPPPMHGYRDDTNRTAITQEGYHCYQPEAHVHTNASCAQLQSNQHYTQSQQYCNPHHAYNSDDDAVTNMDVDIGPLPPLIVVDGANVSYSYAAASLSEQSTIRSSNKNKIQPNVEGINVVAKYFLSAGCRLIVVIPTQWLRTKPRPGDNSQDNAMMMTPQLELLNDLNSRGLLCCAPPTDDDDAYAIAIARRADARYAAVAHHDASAGAGGGFVLSNDLFRDAIRRDDEQQKEDNVTTNSFNEKRNKIRVNLRTWLQKGGRNGSGRVSFAFCDMGSISETDPNNRELDLVPNPRHPLIRRLEAEKEDML